MQPCHILDDLYRLFNTPLDACPDFTWVGTEREHTSPQVQTKLLYHSNQRLGQTQDALGYLLAQVIYFTDLFCAGAGNICQKHWLHAHKSFLQMGQKTAARAHLDCALRIAEANFPSNSTVLKNQRKAYAELC